MGGIARAPGRWRAHLTVWAFTPDDVPPDLTGRTALLLDPASLTALVPAGPGGPIAGDRRARRRQVLGVLTAGLPALPPGGPVLTHDADGVRRVTRDWCASVAERGGWAAAVVARHAVGIDVELADEADRSAAAVLDGIDGVDPARWHGLAGVWAAREAVLKAMGRDLTGDPGGWRFGAGLVTPRGGPPHTVDLVSRPGVVAAVAYAGG